MNMIVHQQGESKVVVIESNEVLILEVQDALDLMATVNYTEGASKIVLQQGQLTEAFFDLSTRIAGDILQKFVNYGVKLAIVGNFTDVSSKSLRDFIYESNHGKQLFFVESVEAAVQALHQV